MASEKDIEAINRMIIVTNTGPGKPPKKAGQK